MKGKNEWRVTCPELEIREYMPERAEALTFANDCLAELGSEADDTTPPPELTVERVVSVVAFRAKNTADGWEMGEVR